jgi:cysteine synthase B
MIHESILQTIGETPMVEITRLNPNPNVPILVKVEGRNPTGSIKDRIALKILEQAEASESLARIKR